MRRKFILCMVVISLIVTLVGCKKSGSGADVDSAVDNSSAEESDTSSIVEYPYYPVTSPIYTDITMDTVKTLYVGMSYEDSIEVLGAPHSYYGSGRVGHVYKLADGTEIIIYYKSGAIEEIRTMPAVDGTYKIIVG